MKNELKLKRLLVKDEWQKIQNSFSLATGLMFNIIDKDGDSLLDLKDITQDYSLDKQIKYKSICYTSNTVGAETSEKEMQTVIYQCPIGLVDFAVPIYLGGDYLGALVIGQARLSEEDKEKYNIEVLPELNKEEYTNEDWSELLESQPTISYEKLKATSKLAENIAKYMTETILLDLTQKELHEKEIELSEEKRNRSEVEKKMKSADLRALNSQLSPHFLFNVLNTIGRLAYIEGAQKTEEIVYEFSDLMRYTLESSSQGKTKIGNELDYSKNYLSIQKTRLGNRLEYQIYADENVKEIACPSMIIQPFVENFIKYVVEPRSIGGHIKINVLDGPEDISIEIEDNGDGIDDRIITSLLNGSYESDNDRTGIGIMNVNERLKHFYGEGYGLNISNQKHGLKIELKIPKDKFEV